MVSPGLAPRLAARPCPRMADCSSLEARLLPATIRTERAMGVSSSGSMPSPVKLKAVLSPSEIRPLKTSLGATVQALHSRVFGYA